MKTYESIAIGIPDILLPKQGVDRGKWAVIACDQFTSEPKYWQKVSEIVGDAPSTLSMIYPEAYLGEKEPEARIERIRNSMRKYLDEGIFEEFRGFIYVERKLGANIRKGLVVCLDLENYDFYKGSSSLVRTTEGTILDRLPPRIKIRKGAPIELPHIMVLIDDPENSVIGPLTMEKERLQKLYDFELMMNSGHLAGYRVSDSGLEEGILDGLKALADPQAFIEKYGLSPDTPVLLFAMGDGNHSLATAKSIWEITKNEAEDKESILRSPLRYALVELVNLHDQALNFEPIHRVLFNIDPDRAILDDMNTFYGDRYRYIKMAGTGEMKSAVETQKGSPHKIGAISPFGKGIIEVSDPDSNLPVGTLQNFLDKFLENHGAREIDYVHGADSVVELGTKPEAMGFYLPAMDKRELFKTVILDGALPRKTFSMGAAWEKRFYMEARKLV